MTSGIRGIMAQQQETQGVMRDDTPHVRGICAQTCFLAGNIAIRFGLGLSIAMATGYSWLREA